MLHECWHDVWNYAGLFGSFKDYKAAVSQQWRFPLLWKAHRTLRSEWMESEVSWERFILARVPHNTTCCIGTAMAGSSGSWPPNYRRAQERWCWPVSVACERGYLSWTPDQQVTQARSAAAPLDERCHGVAAEHLGHFTTRDGLQVSWLSPMPRSHYTDILSHVWYSSCPCFTLSKAYLVSLIKAFRTS